MWCLALTSHTGACAPTPPRFIGHSTWVPGQLIQTALDLELAERTVIADTVGETVCIFLAGLYRAEQVIAERILRLANGKLPWPYVDSEKALPWIEQKT